MEGSTGKLFNHQYPDGINIIVININHDDNKITFRTTDNPVIEFVLSLDNKRDVKNLEELNQDHKKFYIEWEIEIQNDPFTPLPGNGENAINYSVGGRYKTRNMRKNKRTKKSKKTKKLKSRKLFKH